MKEFQMTDILSASLAEQDHGLFIINLFQFLAQQVFVSGIGQRYMGYGDE